jgi:hypothetical protein
LKNVPANSSQEIKQTNHVGGYHIDANQVRNDVHKCDELSSMIHKYGGEPNNASLVNGPMSSCDLMTGAGQARQSRPGV